MARGWPLWGALLWVAGEILLSDVTEPWTALAISTAAFVGSGLVAVAMAGTPRTRVRTMAAMVMAGYHDPASAIARDRLENMASALIEADDRLARGLIAPADHEMVWWRVYQQMDAGRSTTAA